MEEMKTELKRVIKELYDLDFEPEIAVAPENIEADYSSNAPLKLAKELHRNPMEIANSMVTFISDTGPRPSGPSTKVVHPSSPRKNEQVRSSLVSSDGLSRADGANSRAAALRNAPLSDINVTPPGFINFVVSDEYLQSRVGELAEDFEGSIKSDDFAGKTVVCEFSDPNPFKVLHVGHLYTSIVGDSISRLFEYAGAKVVRANFGGDVGLHVAKTMYILKQKKIDELTIEDIARCYVEGTAAYEDDENAKAEITKLNKEIYRINAEDLHDSELAELYWKGRELSYEYFKDFYQKIGVKFDKFYPESTVANLGLQKVKENLESGVYEMSEGAVIFNGEKFGLHTRVFVNKEGVPTYEAKDVGLIFQKDADYHFDKSVVITGSEQLDYMKVVLKSIEQYAPGLVERTAHLTHGLVKLPGNVKMSSRKGNFLKAVDVLEMIREELKQAYDSSDEIVALAATKYAFLKYKMGGDIIFDPKESVKMSGNSGPYLLYSAVRAKKILAKSRADELQNTQRVSIRDNGSELASEPRNDGRERSGERVRVLNSSEERDLMKKLLEYKQTLGECVSEMTPHKLANYLYELAQCFSRFYEGCPVIGCENEAERITLVRVYLQTMTHGLNLLGIEIPEEM